MAALGLRGFAADRHMNQTLTNFRQAVADSTDLQEKVRAGADLVALGKENGYDFSQEELNTGWKELQESDEGLTEFEMDVVSGGIAKGQRREASG
ncbi:MAG: Nif11-like leader peptide family RiPP precursor [Kiritimatiellia bacterium]|jgi:predicted ribosomally synthesized peptide with nif11-like leader|nr:Nif11-like leader peptide family RiPP precursor [Kiritimatiellia bacterium]